MYKVKCKLVDFEGDVQNFPCHFGYVIGDEIYYDGVNFTGKICPHLIVQMMPVVYYVLMYVLRPTIHRATAKSRAGTRRSNESESAR
jgi:uncharacterized repeat protein (TIGR04076 family)